MVVITDEARENMRKAAHKRFEDPKERERISRKLSGSVREDTVKNQISRTMKAKWQDPAFREHVMACRRRSGASK